MPNIPFTRRTLQREIRMFISFLEILFTCDLGTVKIVISCNMIRVKCHWLRFVFLFPFCCPHLLGKRSYYNVNYKNEPRVFGQVLYNQ